MGVWGQMFFWCQGIWRSPYILLGWNSWAYHGFFRSVIALHSSPSRRQSFRSREDGTSWSKAVSCTIILRIPGALPWAFPDLAWSWPEDVLQWWPPLSWPPVTHFHLAWECICFYLSPDILVFCYVRGHNSRSSHHVEYTRDLSLRFISRVNCMHLFMPLLLSCLSLFPDCK